MGWSLRSDVDVFAYAPTQERVAKLKERAAIIAGTSLVGLEFHCEALDECSQLNSQVVGYYNAVRVSPRQTQLGVGLWRGTDPIEVLGGKVEPVTPESARFYFEKRRAKIQAALAAGESLPVRITEGTKALELPGKIAVRAA